MPEHLQLEILRRVADAAPDGIVVCEAGNDHAVVYANAAFEALTGYPFAEVAGKNLRILQGTDREQEGRLRLQEALAEARTARALLRNYRKDGTQFWNELVVQPLRDGEGPVTHFVGYYRDAGERMRSDRLPAALPGWMREDRTTGLASRLHFDELLQREWGVARREERPLSLMLFDVDALGAYNEIFGRTGGDACIRRVARALSSSLRRSADIVARWDGGCLAVLVREGDVPVVLEFARRLGRRIVELQIHHPHASGSRFVTVTGGLASTTPRFEEESPARLVKAAEAVLKRAKYDARNSVLAADDKELAG